MNVLESRLTAIATPEFPHVGCDGSWDAYSVIVEGTPYTQLGDPGWVQVKTCWCGSSGPSNKMSVLLCGDEVTARAVASAMDRMADITEVATIVGVGLAARHARKEAEAAAVVAERATAITEIRSCPTMVLRHTYGSSYRGSGGAYGSVSGVNIQVSDGDNGFVRGGSCVTVIDTSMPASFVASGGDFINEDGRTWKESDTWSPGTGWALKLAS